MVYVANELYHHGILGQRWGKKNGPPYPLGVSDHSASEKKAGWRKSLSGSSDKKKEKRHGLTDTQKKILKYGAMAAGTCLVAYGTYKLYSGVGEIDPETGFTLLRRKESSLESLRKCNPGLVRYWSKTKNLELIKGSTTNCMLCTTNYELRQRGFDVHAGLEVTGIGFEPNEFFSKVYKDFKKTTDIVPLSISSIAKNHATEINANLKFFNSFSFGSSGLTSSDAKILETNLIDQIQKFNSENARGNICVWWPGMLSGGHSMIWEKTKDGIKFMDGQTNKVYNNFAEEVLKNVDPQRPIQLLRTDNLHFNYDVIKNNSYIESDTTLKFYSKHGKEAAENVLYGTYGGQILGSAAPYAIAVAPGIAFYKIGKKNTIKRYKKEHPNTKLTDKEIWARAQKGYI
jgi:hypothetical protein